MNMSYCRFQNTLNDLRDCADEVESMTLSRDENKARVRLIQLCQEIAELYDEDSMEQFEDNDPEGDEQ